MATMLTTRQEFALHTLLKHRDDLFLPASGEDMEARERIFKALDPGDDPYDHDQRPESLLHASLYEVLQGNVHHAEVAITEARQVMYLITEQLESDTLLADLATRWLDRYGRDSIREGVLRHDPREA